MHSILFFLALAITSVLGIHTGKDWTSSVTVDLSTIPRGHSTGTGLNPSPTVPSLTGTTFIPGGTQSVTLITGPGGTSITVPVTVSTTAGGTEITSVTPGGTTTASVPVPDGTTTATAPGTTGTDLAATTGTATTGTTAGAQTAAPSSAAVSHGDVGMTLAMSGVISGSLAFFLGL
ncbi:hypothetical protein H1R20_g10999, partial [Candolleomyces eurysporus]